MLTVAHPEMLLLYWLLPLVAGALVYAHFKRQSAANRFVERAMHDRLMPTATVPRAWFKGTLLVAGLALLIFAASGPRWGTYFEKTEKRGVDCFVCLDVS